MPSWRAARKGCVIFQIRVSRKLCDASDCAAGRGVGNPAQAPAIAPFYHGLSGLVLERVSFPKLDAAEKNEFHVAFLSLVIETERRAVTR